MSTQYCVDSTHGFVTPERLAGGTEDGLRMPPQWNRHLGLDGESFWIVTGGLNHFEWSGTVIRGGSTAAISFSFLSYRVTTHVREMMHARVREKNISTVDCDLNAQKDVPELSLLVLPQIS